MFKINKIAGVDEVGRGCLAGPVFAAAVILSKNINIKNIQDSKKGLDLLVGGPPCQGYSGIGHRRSYSVDKKQLITNHLYQDMAFFINEFNPKIFLFENVRGLLSARWTKSGDKGEIWKDVLETFQNLSNYKIRWELIYSKNYGVPQNRPRILLVGIRNDMNFEFDKDKLADGLLPKPLRKNNPPDLVDLLSDLIDKKHINGGGNKKYVSNPRNNLQKKLRTQKDGTISQIGDPITEQEYSNHSNRIIEKFKYMIENNGNIKDSDKTMKFSQKLLKARWEKSGPNITATSLQDDFVHWEQPRTLTVREWARLQTFPDWYKFMGKRTTGSLRRAGNPRELNFERDVPKYTQIGNAVPVSLAEQIVKNFAKILIN